MAKIHTLTYNGTKSSDLGVFVSGSGSFDAAEFDVDKYEIPGRNGDLILSNNRYKNVEITYPAFIPKAFMDKVQNVRNWLRSSKVYARLEDTYDMDHYRLGIPTGVQSFSPENRNDGANFEMTFDCKPQRFLKVGETPETVEAEPYSIENPTLFDARPLFTVTNPAEGDVIMVNGQAITFMDGYSGTVFIDCETMNAFSGAANLNSIIQATDFPVLVPGTNIVTWTGAGECTMTPRWWEL